MEPQEPSLFLMVDGCDAVVVGGFGLLKNI
jgi:hypothetical protein